jgi:hypothetical protein
MNFDPMQTKACLPQVESVSILEDYFIKVCRGVPRQISQQKSLLRRFGKGALHIH